MLINFLHAFEQRIWINLQATNNVQMKRILIIKRAESTLDFKRSKTRTLDKLEILTDYFGKAWTGNEIWAKHKIDISTLYNIRKQYNKNGIKNWLLSIKENKSEIMNDLIKDSVIEILRTKLPFNRTDVRSKLHLKFGQNIFRARIINYMKSQLNLSYK